MRRDPWDPEVGEEVGLNWGLFFAVGGCMLFWAVVVFVCAKGIAG